MESSWSWWLVIYRDSFPGSSVKIYLKMHEFLLWRSDIMGGKLHRVPWEVKFREDTYLHASFIKVEIFEFHSWILENVLWHLIVLLSAVWYEICEIIVFITLMNVHRFVSVVIWFSQHREFVEKSVQRFCSTQVGIHDLVSSGTPGSWRFAIFIASLHKFLTGLKTSAELTADHKVVPQVHATQTERDAQEISFSVAWRKITPHRRSKTETLFWTRHGPGQFSRCCTAGA